MILGGLERLFIFFSDAYALSSCERLVRISPGIVFLVL
jgi:hypothetical protein